MFKLSEVPNKKIKCLFPQKEKSKTTTKGDSVPKDHALQSGKTILVLREPTPTPRSILHILSRNLVITFNLLLGPETSILSPIYLDFKSLSNILIYLV